MHSVIRYLLSIEVMYIQMLLEVTFQTRWYFSKLYTKIKSKDTKLDSLLEDIFKIKLKSY